MEVKHSRREVWQHLVEAKMQDEIKKIAAIFTPGKLTYLKHKPVFPLLTTLLPHTNKPKDPYVRTFLPALYERAAGVLPF
ncbi:TPA: hypothetical protein SMF67_000813 [Serratia marcescens]|uniref:hypothetical protein n=1 Tax=Serratia marcescens TaxID=615 RepID=UPI0013DC4DA6|nr:hypothetical protein [Serratia marcescens]MDU7468621.1 hypothetical protein [Serratia marcescens]WAZ00960.1 hypothetical protein O3T14_18725 [Serratia marcescens]HEJ7090188.1 hypothetical protein [Serratia marcescens]